MRWPSLTAKAPNRRLKATQGGLWYLALTIGLGVVALVSGNNILYLLESLLLAALILSGVLSERAIAAVSVEIRRAPAVAGSPGKDLITVHNLKNYSLFCLEIGEWKGEQYVPLAFVPRLAPKSSSTVTSKRVFALRGSHDWEGLYVATRYPFGFAEKIRMIRSSGSRIVWPERLSGQAARRAESESGNGNKAGLEISDSEIRPLNHDDDLRLVVWRLSAKGMGDFVRVRRAENASPDATLDVRREAGDEFEAEISRIAYPYYVADNSPTQGTLTIVDWSGKQKVAGRAQILNKLALIRPAGQTRRAQ